jgi:hypothetical protein
MASVVMGECSCSRAAHSRETLTHYANLPLILFSLLNLEGQKIAGCNDCQKGETAGIYLETGNAIAVTSCGDNFLIKSLSTLLQASLPVAGVERVCCIQLNMNISGSFI